VATCPNCGAVGPDGAPACGRCGAPVVAPPPPGGPPPGWSPGASPGAPPARRGLHPLVAGALVLGAGMIGLVVGALVLGGVIDAAEEVRSNALVDALEGTWECDVDPGGDTWTVEIDRAGVAHLTVDSDDVPADDNEIDVVWSIDGGELTVEAADGLRAAGLPDELRSGTLDVTVDGNDDEPVDVDVRRPEEVVFSWSGGSSVVTCTQVDDTPPDLPRGLVEGG